MGERLRTNLDPGEVQAVFHSSVEGDQEDPRVRAANRNNALYFSLFGQPALSAICAEAVPEFDKLLGR